jgi:hypothetical protein
MTLEHLRSRKLRSAPVPGSRGETAPGEMSEWLKEHAWKACMRKRIEGSNPSLSASFRGFEADARGRPRDDGEAVGLFGDVAQLGERLVRNEEVSGSIPLISTFSHPGRV